ncbi:Uncharacterised protein [Chryseobacterium nakagawai]|uniref:Uncharacterized protein n=1 Tax=Chryseobacterium nakagawai TaxID=1241982 RepID=A0AAD0YLB8_CHRNA|nr:hypothetical protein [Chryseobacterium nakagawai]AZA91180.1 hypothetical protein EG343_11330 [Chryseobacterium nakagawai]VEH22745.1 Uncharacterised protein [Chryseobacterium nakagawai]
MSLSSQIFEQYQQEFINRCQEVEDGNVSPLDAAVSFKQEMDYLNQLAEERKVWLNENVDSITDEAAAYGKEGYKGFIFSKMYKETPSFKHIPAWVTLENQKKALEQKSKLAFKMVQNGGLNVDENGEEIPLPIVNTTSYIKGEKVRK